jgi:hypothetical protein
MKTKRDPKAEEYARRIAEKLRQLPPDVLIDIELMVDCLLKQDLKSKPKAGNKGE